MENELRIAKAKDLKAVIDQTKPVTEWGHSCIVWTSLKGDVRVYVNDRKRKASAILIVDLDGRVTLQGQPGNSLTRNEIVAALKLDRKDWN